MISFFTAVVIFIGLTLLGIDYAFLWAVIVYLFNFIPNIGSIIASIPAIILTLVQLGPEKAIIVAILYFFVNIIIGSIVEPKIMGKGLGISSLIVFLSLLFWGGLLGIVGMLLAVPLTIMIKIILHDNINTRWISILLSNDKLVQTLS